MMMSKQYIRTYEVLFKGLSITELDISFKISKSLIKDPNNIELKIYNLNREHRQFLNKLKNTAVEVYLGYKETGNVLAYAGNVRNVFTFREGADWVTELTSAELEKEKCTKKVKKNFGPGTPIASLIKPLANELGITKISDFSTKMASSLMVGGAETFLHGTVISGLAIKQLDRICKTLGITYSIQDGTLMLLDINGTTNEQMAVLNSASGLIGSPVIDADGDIKCVALIQPMLTIGRKINIESELIQNSTYRIDKIEYSGERGGQEWYAKIQGKSLYGVGQ